MGVGCLQVFTGFEAPAPHTPQCPSHSVTKPSLSDPVPDSACSGRTAPARGTLRRCRQDPLEKAGPPRILASIPTDFANS